MEGMMMCGDVGPYQRAVTITSAVASVSLSPCDAYEQALAAVYTRLDDMLSHPVISGRWENSNPPGSPA